MNGKSLGIKQNPADPAQHNRIQWDDIAYKSGRVEAVARTGGREVARHRLETVGKAVALRVEPLVADWKGDGKDLQFVRVTAVDSRGRKVWNATDELTFSVEGNACLAGVTGGDITSEEIYTDDSVRLFHGTALAILRSGSEAGGVTLTVSSPGFKKAVRLPLSAR